MAKLSKTATLKGNKETKRRPDANKKPISKQQEDKAEHASLSRKKTGKEGSRKAFRSKQPNSTQKASPLLASPWSMLTVEQSMDAMKAIRKGLPSSFVGKAARLFRLTPVEFSKLTSIVHRQDNQSPVRRRRLTVHESDSLYRSIRAVQMAEAVFEDFESATKWMREPLRALGRQCPLSLMDTNAGFDFVTKILGCIEHGMPA